MPATDSHLSLSQYGYDYVVATSQGAINATLKEYLSGLRQPEFVVCYSADSNGKPVQVDYQQLVATCEVDPFSISGDADPMTNQQLLDLFQARFMFGIKASLGLPRGLQPLDVPDIVTLSGDTSAVTYTLMCADFQVVELAVGYGPRQWLNQSQGSTPWLFTSKVDLRLADSGSNYSNLPPAIQAAIKNLGQDAFGIQQLMLDLDNAGLESTPAITNVQPGSPLYNCLQNDFLNVYFKALQANGAPVLAYVVKKTETTVPASTLTLTDLNFMTAPLLNGTDQPISNPTPDQLDATTLNYLCATDGHTLPRPMPLGWNWLETTDESNFDGVVAINKAALRDYFMAQIADRVATNCWKPNVKVTADLPKADFSWSMSNGQTPSVDCSSNAYVVQYTYSASASDGAGANDVLGQMSLDTSYTLTLDFSDAIAITQYLKIHVHLEADGSTADGNVVDKVLTDTYTLAVDAEGRLNATLTQKVVDTSQSLTAIGVLSSFTGFSQLTSDVLSWGQYFGSTKLTDIPVGIAQSFVFPGGKSLVFKDVAFSWYGDLIAHFTYADPS